MFYSSSVADCTSVLASFHWSDVDLCLYAMIMCSRLSVVINVGHTSPGAILPQESSNIARRILEMAIKWNFTLL